jgi:predicted Zn-dependent protease
MEWKGLNVEIPTKEIALMMEVGHLCRYARRFREARDIFQGVGTLLRVRDTADLALAAVAFDEQKFDEAKTLCRRVLNNDRRNVSAYAQLAELHISRNEMADALNLLKVARDLRPAEPVASFVNALLRFTELRLKLEQAAKQKAATR